MLYSNWLCFAVSPPHPCSRGFGFVSQKLDRRSVRWYRGSLPVGSWAGPVVAAARRRDPANPIAPAHDNSKLGLFRNLYSRGLAVPGPPPLPGIRDPRYGRTPVDDGLRNAPQNVSRKSEFGRKEVTPVSGGLAPAC